MMRLRIRRQGGAALLIVLWIMALLATLAFALSLLVRVESLGVLAFRQELQDRHLAEGGLTRGIMELLYRSTAANSPLSIEPWRVDGRANHGATARGRYTVRLTAEDGKLDINMLSDQSGPILAAILREAGVQPEEADSIVDCVLDWKDADDLHRLNGAEDDYYLGLPEPYRARNGQFESLEELLLVKGMTPAILFGQKGKRGIIGLLTIYSRSGALNPNAAPRELLAAIPGIGPQGAGRIVEQRESAQFGTLEEVMGAAGGDAAAAAPFLALNESQVYSIEATGYRHDEKRAYPVSAVVRIEGAGSYSFLSYRCPTESDR